MAVARLVLGLGLFAAQLCLAEENRPRISIIIDDLGYRASEGQRALALPGPVSYAILPYSPFAKTLSRRAQALGREVLIHMPMEAEHGERGLGPGALLSRMTEHETIRLLQSTFLSLPDAVGVNNHMGSLMTQQERPMRWVMETLLCHGRLFFVDSRTTPHTVAAQMAQRYSVPHVSRDVFLDHDPSPAQIQNALARLLRKAQQFGSAVGIGHPHSATMSVLERMLPRLHEHGVQLVKLSELMTPQTGSTRLVFSAAGASSARAAGLID